MAYGDVASAYGRGEANGMSLGASRGYAVSHETPATVFGNWAGAPNYRPSSGLGPPRSAMTNFQAMVANSMNRGTMTQTRDGWGSGGGSGMGQGGESRGGFGALPRPTPAVAPPYAPPPPVRPPTYFGPPMPAPETVGTVPPVSPGTVLPGTGYSNPPMYNPFGGYDYFNAIGRGWGGGYPNFGAPGKGDRRR